MSFDRRATAILTVTLAAVLTRPGDAHAAQRPPSRRPPDRARVAARPPYMQHLRVYEEGTFVTRGVLKNGLTVLVNEYRAAPILSLLAYARKGPLDESPQQLGACARLARTLFRATGSRRPGVLEAEIRSLGGGLESAAAFDHVVWNLVAPGIQWKRALELTADALLDPILDAGERSACDWGGARVFRSAPESPGEAALWELAWGRTPFGGPAAHADDAPLADLRRSVLAPGRLLIVVSGDCNASDVLAESVRLFGRVAAGPKDPPAARFPPVTGTLRYRQLRLAGPASGLEVGFATPGPAHDDFPALEVAAAVLGLGDGAVIPRRLRDQKALIHDGGAKLVGGGAVGLLHLALDVAPENLDRTEIALFTELELLKRGGPSSLDVARARAQLEREHWLRQETVQGRTALLARHEALGDWKGMNNYLSRLRGVTPSAVAAVARKYLDFQRAALVEVLPEQAETRPVDRDVLARTLASLLDVAVIQEAAARETETIPAFQLPAENRAFRYSEVRYPMLRASVLRGPELFIREDHTAPIVEAGLFFPGGRLVETPDNAGITALMLDAMLRGGRAEARDRFQQQLDLYGARLVPVVADDYFGYRLTVLSGDVEAALDLIAGVVKAPTFSAEVLARVRARQRLAAQRLEAAAGAEQTLRAALFAGFPYGLPPLGTDASQAALTPERLAAWHKGGVVNRKPVVVIVGDTQGTTLARYFVRNFSGSRYQDVALPETLPPSPRSRLEREQRRPASGSMLLAGFAAPPDGDEDAYAMRVIEALTTGPAGRLDDALREQQHVVDEVSVEYRPRLRAGSVVARAHVRAGEEERAGAALLAEIAKLRNLELSYRDYRAAVNRAVTRFWLDQQPRFAQVLATVAHALLGRGVDELATYPSRLQAVREEDLAEVAGRILDPSRAVLVRVRPQ